VLALVAAGVGCLAQNPADVPPPPPETSAPAASKPSTKDDDQYQKPPEEDETEAPKVYTFNPIMAKRDMMVGGFYYKKGKYKAAAMRFDEATKWNPGLSEAWYRLGETEDKLGDLDAMRKAWTKYLELEPNAKESASVKKKLAQASANKS
jgi:tetratricopeptide (TPR) repeat protein